MNVPTQILEAATRLMAARGFDGTSLQSIADAVGIRKASLLYHFSSKKVLRQAVLDRLLSHWNEVLPRLLMASARAGVDRFDAVVNELITFFSVDPDRARLLLREILDRPRVMRRYLAGYVQPWIELVGQYIKRGQKTREIRPNVDAEAYVLNVVSFSLAALATSDGLGVLLGGESETARRRYIAELMRMMRTSLFTDTALDAADAALEGREVEGAGAFQPPPTK